MVDNPWMVRQVPSTVHFQNSSTPKAKGGNKKQRNSKRIEVDAYDNPSELFQYINYGNYKSATACALEHPREARTWIVSRHKRNSGKEGLIKWKYLPLHMVCMKKDPPKNLFEALVLSYPEGIKERDFGGNLPIHYLLSEGCKNGEFLQTLLRAYPESVSEKNNEGKSLMEIVSGGYHVGKLDKETMVDLLAILRQWAIDEGQQRPNLRIEQREDGEFNDSKVNLHPPLRDKNEWKSSKVGSNRNTTLFIDTSDGQIRSNNGISPDSTTTDRDMIRKSFNKLKDETKIQDFMLSDLNSKGDTATATETKLKNKLQKKREKVEELQAKLKETMKDQEDKISMHKQIFHDKEMDLAKKDLQISEMQARIESLSKENEKLRNSSVSQSEDTGKTKSALEKSRDENVKLKLKIDEMITSKKEGDDRAEANTKSLRDKINDLESQIDDMQSQVKESRTIRNEAEALQTERKLREKCLLSRISTLEKELMENLGDNFEDRLSQIAASSGLAEERDALKEMNASLQEHVGALKERCQKLESIEQSKEELQKSVQRLESDLITARLKQTKNQEEMEQFRSDSLIRESRLQTQVAKLERDLLEELGSKELVSTGTNSEEEKLMEDLQASQIMNSSLQGHLAVLKEKCNILENTLDDAKEKNDSLRKEIKSLKADTLNAREKEVTSDYEQLIAMIQDISNSGKDIVGSEDLSILQDENDSLRDANQSLRKACEDMKSKFFEAQTKSTNLQQELDTKLKDARKVEEKYVRASEALEWERDRLEEKNKILTREKEEETILLKTKLNDLKEENNRQEERNRGLIKEQEEQTKVDRGKLSKIEEEHNRLEHEIRRLTKELDEKNQSLIDSSAELEAEKLKLEKEREKLEEEKVEMEKRNKGIKSEKDVQVILHKNQIEKLQSEKEKVESEKYKLEVENEALIREQNNTAISHDKQLSRMEEEREKLEEKIKMLTKEQDGQKNTQSERLFELELQKARLEEINKSLSFDQSKNSTDFGAQLKEIEKKSDKYKEQLIHLKERHEKMKTKNAELREIISKNNETYLYKVQSLSKEVEEVRAFNNSLHRHIQELSTENELIQDNKSNSLTRVQQKKIDEMKIRLNQIAGYLIAVVLSVEEEKKMQSQDVDLSSLETSKKKIYRDNIREELIRRQRSVLSNEERDDIIDIATRLEKDVRSPYKFSEQRDNLNDISVSLQKLTDR